MLPLGLAFFPDVIPSDRADLPRYRLTHRALRLHLCSRSHAGVAPARPQPSRSRFACVPNPYNGRRGGSPRCWNW